MIILDSSINPPRKVRGGDAPPSPAGGGGSVSGGPPQPPNFTKIADEKVSFPVGSTWRRVAAGAEVAAALP